MILMRAAKKGMEKEDILQATYLRKCVPHVRLTWTNDSYIVNMSNRFNTNIKGNVPPHSNAQSP